MVTLIARKALEHGSIPNMRVSECVAGDSNICVSESVTYMYLWQVRDLWNMLNLYLNLWQGF